MAVTSESRESRLTDVSIPATGKLARLVGSKSTGFKILVPGTLTTSVS